MTAVSASAPGKVVLCGEYAVLDGAPAIAMAVDCRAVVRVADHDADWHRVTAPGFTTMEGRFVEQGTAIEWLQGKPDFGLVDAVLRTIDFSPSARLAIELDTRAFHDTHTGEKLGLGASAALTVALVAALRGTGADLGACLAAHRRFQAGAGSGIDVAAAFHGGLFEYRMRDARVRSMAWPEGLHYRLVWTGTAADTRARLAKLARTRTAGSTRKLVDAAASIATAWGSAAAVLDAYPDYIEQLRRFSVDHDLGIFDAGHDQLAAAAAAEGLVYKPCGAGGGDVGIVLGSSEKQLDDFVADGIRTLPCHLDADGVMRERH